MWQEQYALINYDKKLKDWQFESHFTTKNWISNKPVDYVTQSVQYKGNSQLVICYQEDLLANI